MVEKYYKGEKVMKMKRWLSVFLALTMLFALSAPALAVTESIVSDPTTQWSADGITYYDSFECFEHTAWADNGIEDVKWIWRTAVTDPNTEYDTVPADGWYYKKTFTIPFNAKNISGILKSNCDNAYVVYINGVQILSQGTMNIEGPDGRDYTTLESNIIANLVPGENIILIRAMNYFSDAEGSKIDQPMYGDGYTNPAGLIYKLDLTYDLAELYSIDGFKYDDETGTGIAGWPIYLEKWDGEKYVSAGATETGSDGRYCFDKLLAGQYRVSEGSDPGWEQVFPGGDGTHIVTLPNESMIYGIQRYTGQIYEVDPSVPNAATLYKQINPALLNLAFSGTSPNGIAFDQATGDVYFATYAPSTISRLYKFEGDVQRDLGNLVGSVASGEFYNGKYYYINDNTDDLYVVSFKADGTIDAITPHLSISSNVSQWYFGDIVVDHLEGVIYGEGQNSLTGNQEFFKVNLDGSGYLRIKVSGYVGLLQLAIGTNNTLFGHSAATGEFFALNRTTGAAATISDGANLYTDISSASICHYNFRNKEIETSEICGYKYEAGTTKGLAGWTINLYKMNDAGSFSEEPIATDVTDADGKYCFENLFDGEYKVIEIISDPDHWKQILPASGEHRVSLPSGDSDCDAETNIYNFENAKLYSICGYKHDDDTGEALAGWEITLEQLVDDVWVLVVQDGLTNPVNTDADGKYCFARLLAGEYRVKETPQYGWEQVYPDGDGMHLVTLPTPPVVYGIKRSSGNIFAVEPYTADPTQVLDTNIGFTTMSPNGLAYDIVKQELYYVQYPGTADLFKSDLSGLTADDIYLGDLGHAVACADFYDGKYYFIAGGAPDGSTDDLYEVSFDPATGMIAGIKAFPNISLSYNSAWTFNGDIAISAEGIIYGFGMKPNGVYEFFSVNRDGSGFDMIQSGGYSFSLQLAFNGDGVLVGHDAVGGRFFEVDLVTGAITQISDGEYLYTDLASGLLTYNFENRTTLGNVSAFKFYDANVNGIFDPGESPIRNWKIQILEGEVPIDEQLTDANGLVNFTVPYGNYTIKEILPDNDQCWVNTTALTKPVTVVRRETADRVDFGNVCLGAGGGMTLGFWSNKNGQALIDLNDLEALRDLGLVDLAGNFYDPYSGKDFRTWLLSSNASNMSSMLSAQLAAMKLNVLNGKVLGTALIYAPGIDSINDQGFATVNAVMAEANLELIKHPTAYEMIDSWWAYQRDLKDALDNANNNYNFLQPTASCPIIYLS